MICISAITYYKNRYLNFANFTTGVVALSNQEAYWHDLNITLCVASSEGKNEASGGLRLSLSLNTLYKVFQANKFLLIWKNKLFHYFKLSFNEFRLNYVFKFLGNFQLLELRKKRWLKYLVQYEDIHRFREIEEVKEKKQKLWWEKSHQEVDP